MVCRTHEEDLATLDFSGDAYWAKLKFGLCAGYIDVDVEVILAQAKCLFASLSIIYSHNTIKYIMVLLKPHYGFQLLEFALWNYVANIDQVVKK